MFNGHPSSSPLGDHMSNAVIKTLAAAPSITFEVRDLVLDDAS